jgi:leader peptidase (prepilin peptidase)/N-methyltransferase
VAGKNALAWQLLLPLFAPLLGSFIGLLTLRLPAGEPVVAGRSACAGCKRTLGPIDLVPILSFLWLRGRCRTCRAPIPRRYLLIELACVGVAVWAVFAHGWPLAAASAVLGWWLLLIAFVDAEHFWLPWRFTLPLGAAGLLAAALLQPQSLSERAIGAVAGVAVLWGLAWLYRRVRGREGLGGGDPALLGAAGAWVGWTGLPSVLLYASLAGLSLVLAQALLRRRVRLDDRLPFGVFLAAGIWLTWLYGPLGR